MPASTVFEITAETWTKVATAVVAGDIHVQRDGVFYYHAFVETGDPAPTGTNEAVRFLKNARIEAQSPIDAYVYCVRGAGKIRVDTP